MIALFLLLLAVLFGFQIRRLNKQDKPLHKKIIFFFSPVKLIAFTVLSYSFYQAIKHPAGYSLFFALYVIPAASLLLLADYFSSRLKNRKDYYIAQFLIILFFIAFAGSLF